MISLLVPGVNMGGSGSAGGGGGSTLRLLPMTGVGRAWWWIVLPTLLVLGA